MKTLSAWLILIFFAACAASISAQSGGETRSGAGKTNQRKPAATPTPAAIPKDDSTAANQTGSDDGDVIKVSVQLVSVPVRVMDKKGRFVAGLTKANFAVTEDGVKQDIAMFSNEREPFTVALVLDMSYSTTFKLAEIHSAAIAFIDQLRPRDKVMVVSFDQDVHVLCEATSDRQAIYRAIKSTKISTGTSLYEAVDLVINERLRHVEGRKAMILFTDGVDTTSRQVNDLTNLSDALEMDSLIYPIRYDTFSDVQAMRNKSTTKPPPISAPTSSGGVLEVLLPTLAQPGDQGTTAEEYRRAEEYLDQLAIRTGGRIYHANSTGNLADAFSRIASELREFYSLGYYPLTERVAGNKTRVKVRVDRTGLAVRTRDGYVISRKQAAKR